jgi:two-component system CheB/CheR fusion protein
VAGCATGEEAYSIAITLREYFEETGHVCLVQIFASDISATAVERARSGKFAETIAANVSPERLNRYFSKVDGGYQISKELREMCVFSRHDLIHDPPFSKLDLISCQNVLIFFGSVRKNVIARFHYALTPGGFLVLGRSETESGNLFSSVEGTHSIYTKIETVGKARQLYDWALGLRRSPDAYERMAGLPASHVPKGMDLRKELERTLLSRYSGAGVVVDGALEVLEIFGQTGPYLTLPPGKVSLNLLKLVPETRLFLEVEKLVSEVERSGHAARKTRVRYQADGSAGEVNVEVIPLGVGRPGALLVLFEPAPATSDLERVPDSDPRDREIASLKEDLADARQRLLSIIDEHQSSAEENQNTTEEAISANEELQSLNEELETAKEELQSTNEELITVNQELLSNNAALAEARDFAMLIIETAAAPSLVLDQELRIKAANPSFYRAFRISPGEAGGQFLYSMSNGCWDIPRLRDMLQRILPDKKRTETHSEIPAATAEKLKRHSATILVVEDEELLRLSVSKALRKRGFYVVEASDGHAAMDLIRANTEGINVVLLDFTLPGLSSREVFEETQRIRPDLKIILTSAYGKETVEASFAGLPVAHFIRKPFQLEILMSALKDVLAS